MAILLLTPYGPTNTHSIPAPSISQGEERGPGKQQHANNFSSSQARNIFRAWGREEKYFFLPRSDPWPLKSNSAPARRTPVKEERGGERGLGMARMRDWTGFVNIFYCFQWLLLCYLVGLYPRKRIVIIGQSHTSQPRSLEQ